VSAALSVLFEPFLPQSSHRLNQMLGIARFDWNDVLQGKTLIFPGHPLGEVTLLFAKIEDETIDKQIYKLKSRSDEMKAEQALQTPAFAPQKDFIDYDLFGKMDIRTGKILEAVKVPKADKLLQLTVDTGIDTRTIVSGIANYYTPEEIIGKDVLVLVNLEPRKLKGIESQGMILMAESPDGSLHFVQATEGVIPGMIVK
jgi:methionyl-tRNA synthetase